MKKRIFSFLMAVAMVVSILPLPALAAEGCANHPVHDESCGYVAAVEGQPCNHQHSEECRVETVNCTHVHTAECYPEGNMDGEPALCAHVCSVESGCVTVSCNHVHNAECGYVEAVAGQPCNHSCELCNPPEEPEEKIVCICDIRCNEMVNTDCPVCAVDASQCAVPEASNDLPPVPQAVLDVQAMIDALPSLEEVQAMTDKGNAYNQTQAAYEAYLALTEEEKALVTGTESFEVLFTYFNEQIMMLPAEVTYMNADGSTGTCDTYTSVTDQTTWNEGWYVVDSNRTISAPINVNGNVSLILVDGCTLNASKGVLVNGGSLTIYGQSSSSGTLVATASAAAIDTGTGTVTINSGNVNAEGGNTGGAGIGTKAYTDAGGGTVIINGGTVTAKSNWGGAGIGSGGYTDQSGAKYGSVIITGGTVTAQGAKNAAGIGAGWYGGINSVSITGGTVTTTCGDYCSNDIGSGVAGPCPSITIGPDAVINNSSGNPANIGGAGSITYLATSVTLNQSEVSLTVGETATLAATVLPEKAAETNTVSWTTSDQVVATVSNGVVTAVAPGTATITATAGGKSAECTVTVMKVPVTGVALDKTSATIVIGSTLQLTATVSPENATNQRVTWGSNNRGVATVDSNGLVTAVSEGEASIILTTADGGKSASCKVTVLAPVTYLDANGNQQTCTDYTPVTEDMTSLGEDGKETWYVVNQNVTLPDRGPNEILYAYGDVHLILKDDCTLFSTGFLAVENANLAIYAQSTEASMGKCSGLGSENHLGVVEGGSLTINGGFIDAKTEAWQPAITLLGNATLTINGGIVKATRSQSYSQAIGPNFSGGGCIRIYGGEVIAVGNIGAYENKTCTEIYISGNAKVTDGEDQFPGVSNAESRFIGVRSITLPSTLTLGVDGSETLTPTMFPAVATDISWTSDNESVATVDASGRVTAVSAGTANITVTGQVEKNGAVKTATCAVTVNKLDSNLPLVVKNGSEVTSTFTYGDTITVEFTPAVKAATRLAAPAINEAALLLGDTQLTGPVTADGNGKFTLSYDTSNKGIPIGENQTLTVRYGGSDKLNAGTADVTVTLNPKPVTVSGVAAVSRDYAPGSTTVTLDLNNAAVVGKVGTDDVTVSGGTGTMADANAGNNKAVAVAGITLGGTHAGFYSLTAQPADVTVTITPKEVTTPTVTVTPDSYVYTGSPITPTSVVVKDGETVIPDTEYTVAYANNTNVGTATVTITDNEGGNYAVSGSATFEIAVSGTNGGVTLDHANKTYIYGESVGVTVTVQPTGEAPSLLTALANLLTGNDNTVSIYQGNTCLAGPTEVVDGKAVFTLDSAALGVGTWNLEARFSGSDNMDADTQPFQVIVNQKELTVTGVAAVERDYEPNNMTVVLNLDDAELVGLVGADEVTVSGGTGAILTDSAAVNKPVTVTGLTLGGKDAENYTLKQPEGLLVTIKQVTVTITANDATAKTGEEMPTTFGYTVDGLLGQDQLTTPPTFTCDADMSKAGTYDIVPGGAEVNSNYTLSYVNGTLTVQQSTTEIIPGDTVRYIVEHYKGDTLAEKEVLGGKIGETVTAVDKNYEGYRVNTDKSTMSGTLVKLEKPEDIVILKVYYDLKVNGVSLNKTTLTLTEGNTETLTATVTPEGAVNKTVTWFSSNTDVATVDANGKVTAVKEGKAAITVTTADGGFVATCEVTVKPAAYTVTFDSNGGSAVAAQTVENGKKAAKPADPTLAKHNFKGWYTDEECTKAYDFDTPVTGNLTLHAKWAEVYTFTLNYKANTSATVRNMPKDESVTSERNEMTFRLSYSKPKRSGYTFTGWNTQSNGKGKKYQPGDDVPGIKDGTVTLYAQWKQNSGSWWDNPKTGDYIMIAVAVLAVSGAALAGLLVYAKKKKK